MIDVETWRHIEVSDNSWILLTLLSTNGWNLFLVVFIQENVIVESVYKR